MRALRIGIVLLVLGAACWFARGPFGGHERAWSADPVAPTEVHLTAGRTYHLSTVGGPGPGEPVVSACEWAPGNGSAQAASLPLVAISTDRVIHRVAAFVGPASGQIHITCAGVDQVFVDDADGVGRDPGSVLLVASIVLGTAGLIFCAARLGAQRRLRSSGSTGDNRHDAGS